MIRVLFLSKNFNNALTLYFLLKIDTYYILFEILHCLDLLVKSVIKKLWTFINQKIFPGLVTDYVVEVQKQSLTDVLQNRCS